MENINQVPPEVAAFKQPSPEIPAQEVDDIELAARENPEAAETIIEAIKEANPEPEKAPGWFKNAVQKISAAWFDPKSFETEKGYKDIGGLMLMKKFHPISGDLVLRMVWHRLGARFVPASPEDSLKTYDVFNKLMEAVHSAFFVAINLEIANAYLTGNYGVQDKAFFLTALNVVGNVYPIMLQRYNRIRLYRVMNKMKARQSHQPTEAENKPEAIQAAGGEI